MANTEKSLLAAIKSLLVSGKYSDFTIACGPDEHKVHKAVVCSQSSFFENAIKFGKEAEEQKVTLPEDEPEVVKLMIKFFYEGDYSEISLRTKNAGVFPHTCSNDMGCQADRRGKVPACHDENIESYRLHRSHHYCGGDCDFNCVRWYCEECWEQDSENGPRQQLSGDQLITHTKLYEIAEKYDIPILKELSRQHFDSDCIRFWDDDSFPVAAVIAFSTTPEDGRGLRDIVSNTIADHMTLIEKAEIEALMLEFSNLTFGLLKAKSEADGWK